MSFNPLNPLGIDPIGGAIGGALGFGGGGHKRKVRTPDARTSWRHLAPPTQGAVQPQTPGAQGAGAQTMGGDPGAGAFGGAASTAPGVNRTGAGFTQPPRPPQFGPQLGGEPLQQGSHPSFAGPAPAFTPGRRSFTPQGPPTGGMVPQDTYMQGPSMGRGVRNRGGQNVPNWWGADMIRGMLGESTGDYARRINNQGDIAG